MKKYLILLITLMGYITYLSGMEIEEQQVCNLENVLAIPFNNLDEKETIKLTRKISRYILDDQKLWHKQNYRENNALDLLQNTHHDNLSFTTQEKHFAFHPTVMLRCHRGWVFTDCWNSSLSSYANVFNDDTQDHSIGIWDTSTCKNPELLHHNKQLEKIAFCYNDTALIAKECGKETYILWQSLNWQQTLLYILLQKFLLIEKPPKNITNAGSLLCHVALRLSLNATQLREIWQTFPHTMQKELWNILKRFITTYGK